MVLVIFEGTCWWVSVMRCNANECVWYIGVVVAMVVMWNKIECVYGVVVIVAHYWT